MASKAQLAQQARADMAQQVELEYAITLCHLYRTTSGVTPNPRDELGCVRQGTDITVHEEEEGSAWISREDANPPYRFRGYSLCPSLISARVRPAEAGQERKTFFTELAANGKKRQTWVRGHVFRLPAGTPLAPINFCGHTDSDTHHTIFPISPVPVVQQHGLLYRNQAICDLPWVQEEGIFFIKANADIPDYDEPMDPETYDLLFALHRAFDLLSDAAGTDLAVDMQVRIIEAGIPPLSQLGEELLTQCCDLLRSAGIEPESMFEFLLPACMMGNLDCSIATAGARTEVTKTTSSSVEGLSSM
jgi:hypothetical protein